MNNSEVNENVLDNNNSTKGKDVNVKPATFEEAIDAAGFGIFNIVLIVVAAVATFANTFSTTTMAYILPIAECDLKLTLLNKGTLNAATYAGTIGSAFLWGYMGDTLGRRKILNIGYLVDMVCVLCCALSLNFEMLVTFKFFEGFIINGPSTVLYPYLTEVHNAKLRPRLIMALGFFQSLGAVVLPMLAWLILPQSWTLTLSEKFQLHSWNIFLIVCSFPSLFAGLTISILPESPKFLMYQGHNDKALESFQQIYSWNKRKPKHTYPINFLVEEVPNRDVKADPEIYTIESASEKPVKRTKLESLHDGWRQIKPMFQKPLLYRSAHVYLMQFCTLLGLNTIRLWLPQLFASISEYEALPGHDKEMPSDLCTILEYSVNRTMAVTAINITDTCSETQNISIDTYINNIIISVTCLLGYGLAAIVIKSLGPNRLLVSSFLVSGCIGLSFYWSRNGLTTLILAALFVMLASIAASSLMGAAVTFFPTTLRTIIVSLALMFGRLGALSGNLLFPVFIQMGCLPPFVLVGAVLLLASLLTYFLPDPKKTDFK